MPMLQVSYNPTTRVALVQADNAAVPGGSTDIGSFNHPDPVYPDSLVLFHGVRDLLYKRKPDGTPGFWPENITDLNNVTIDLAEGLVIDPVAVTGVTLTPATVEVEEGDTTQLTATVAPANATNKAVTYASSATGTATVNSSGLVTGVAAGTATITVTTTDGAFTDTTEVTVTEAA